MVRQQENAPQAQLVEDLRADAIIAIEAVTSFGASLTLIHAALLHHRVRAQLMDEIQAMLALTKIEHHALAGFRNFFQSPTKLPAGIVDRRSEHVAGDVLAMHPHHHGIVCAHLAHHHRQMHVAVDCGLKSNRAKGPVDGREIRFDRATYEHFFRDSVANQISDTDDLQTVDAGELAQLRQPRHGAVFIHDFADDSGWIETGDARDIYRSFRLSRTNQHAALLRPQRKYMTGSREVLRLGARIDGGQDCRGAISRRYSRRHSPTGFNGHRERRA